jgi:ubiquinone biosynthesis protein
MSDAGKVLLELVLFIPGLVLVTFVATRLLGVRRSWVANITSVVLGSVLGTVIALVIADGNIAASGFLRNSMAMAFVMTMVVAVGADLLAKPGSLAKGEQAGLFVVPHPLTQVRSAIDDARRTREIIQILTHNGFGLRLGLRSRREKRAAIAEAPVEVRLRATLEQCGGMFVKLGQMASTRTDVFPPDVIEVLSHLQSQVTPEPPSVMKELLEQELGSPMETVFAEFDWEPIAAASIGQVYRATLRSGERVIVKAQRPNVAELVRRDSKVLLRLAQSVENNTPVGAEYRVYELAEEFTKGLAQELDFRIESRSTETIRENMATQPGIRVAKIYNAYSTGRVMVQERLEGISVAESEELRERGFDREALADTLLRAALTQMMTNGFFHADLHPGNVMVLDDGTVGMIDFGATGRLDPLMMSSLQQMLVATSLHDAALLRQAVSEVAEIGPDVDPDALERALSRFMAEHVAPGAAIGASAVHDLMQMLTTFGIRVPAELTTFSRALVILEGTLATMCPGYKLSEHVQGIAQEWAAEKFDPGSMDELVKAELIQQLPTLRQLPRHADRIADLIERGTLTTRVSLFSTPADVHLVTKLVNRFTLAFLGAVLGLISAVLMGTDRGPILADGTQLLHIFGAIGLACGSVLMLRVVAAIVRDGLN